MTWEVRVSTYKLRGVGGTQFNTLLNPSSQTLRNTAFIKKYGLLTNTQNRILTLILLTAIYNYLVFKTFSHNKLSKHSGFTDEGTIKSSEILICPTIPQLIREEARARTQV